MLITKKEKESLQTPRSPQVKSSDHVSEGEAREGVLCSKTRSHDPKTGKGMLNHTDDGMTEKNGSEKKERQSESLSCSSSLYNNIQQVGAPSLSADVAPSV